MKHFAWMSLLACAALAAPAHAENDHVALFKNVSGTVRVLRDGGAVDAVPGTTLFIADRLSASKGASAGIVFRDGTLITLGPGAELLVRDYVFEPKEARYAFSVYLSKGSAIYSSGKIGKIAPESVKVESPIATVGVRGTRFILHAD